jgi:glucosamine kinase
MISRGTLIAESGATKTEWTVWSARKVVRMATKGISPYFMTGDDISRMLAAEILPKLKRVTITTVHYYGTGMRNPKNVAMLKKALKVCFGQASITIRDDLLAAARGVAGNAKGIICNLGTGSFCCYYNGSRIAKRSPGIGYILGDEGSGAYLGKKVLQYYLYNTFDEELKYRFEEKYKMTGVEILENVYRKPFANRFMASFCLFLSENRGHYMIENIIEDGLNDFFFYHLQKYREATHLPVNFVGSVAVAFEDRIRELCDAWKFQPGRIIQSPMDGLISFHR